MAKIETTLPTVQFGNVKVTFTPEELGLSDISDSHALGVAAAVYLNLFQQGFKVGAKMDVDAHLGAEQATSVPEAQAMLDEGLGGVSEVPSADDVRAAESVIGSSAPDDVQRAAMAVIDAAQAPWDKPQVDSKPKPWETGTSTPDKLVAGLGDGW